MIVDEIYQYGEIYSPVNGFTIDRMRLGCLMNCDFALFIPTVGACSSAVSFFFSFFFFFYCHSCSNFSSLLYRIYLSLSLAQYIISKTGPRRIRRGAAGRTAPDCRSLVTSSIVFLPTLFAAQPPLTSSNLITATHPNQPICLILTLPCRLSCLRMMRRSQNP